jgi:hypothetical protein
VEETKINGDIKDQLTEVKERLLELEDYVRVEPVSLSPLLLL